MGTGASIPASEEEALAQGFSEVQIQEYLAANPASSSKAPEERNVPDIEIQGVPQETARMRNRRRLHYSPPPSPEGPPPWLGEWCDDLEDLRKSPPSLHDGKNDEPSEEDLNNGEKEWSWFDDTGYSEDERFGGPTKEVCGASESPEEKDDDETRRKRAVEALSKMHLMEPSEVYEIIAKAFMRHFQKMRPIAMVNFIDDDRRWFCNFFPDKVGPHFVKKEPKEMGSFCQRCMDVYSESSGEASIYVSDVASNPRFMNQDIVAGPPNFSWYCGAVIHIPNPSGPEKGPVPVGTVCFLETGGGGGESLSLKEHEAKKLAQFAEDASLLLTARCVPRTSKRVYAQAENPGLEADSELGVLQEE